MEKEFSKKFLTNAPKCDIVVSVNGKMKRICHILTTAREYFKVLAHASRELFHAVAWLSISLAVWGILLFPLAVIVSNL